MVADAAARTARPLRLALQVASAFAAWPGLLAEPRAPVSRAEELDFRERNAFWIEDWARLGPRGALADQVRFDREWAALRAHAEERGVRLIGDVPIYVAPGSADHRAHPELFHADAVAGTPPDAYTDKGQLWGNPLYDWPALQRRGYRWWTERFRRTFELYDLARIDHFRGFVAYWAVPARRPPRAARALAARAGPGAVRRRRARRSARAAADRRGPRRDHAGGRAAARRRSACPGMVVLQFGFDPDDPRSAHPPDNHTEDAVVYTGTHDNDTVRGWYDVARAGCAPRSTRRSTPPACASASRSGR